MNVTINLINRLVTKGVLSQEDADDLIKQAEADAVEARKEQAAVVQAAVAQAAPPPPLFPQVDPATAALEAQDDAVRVQYIPESVKNQLRDSIKDEVMAQARAENWAAPRSMPEWTTRIKLFGDIRVRYEGDMFPEGNDNTGAFPNFNSINTGAPFDTAGTQFSPQYDVDQNRQRFRIRARLGVDADLGDGFSAGMRLATGENDSPVTTNQSLGLANGGQGGNFSKYSIWLDRAFLKYEVGGTPAWDVTVLAGRFDNPFYSTSTILWANELGFDGFAIRGRYEMFKGFSPFLNAGAFPVFNTDFNFASNQPAKFSSTDKWLYAGQTGFDWKINKDFNLKSSIGYFYFHNVEGRLSNPYTPLNSTDAGNTDDTRPAFAQNGNTYRPLRDIVPTANNNFGTIDQFQYYGLATPFHVLDISTRLDFNHWEPFQVSVFGEYVKNLALDSGAVDSVAVNNRGANTKSGALGVYGGGDTAWIIGSKVGAAALEKRWDWNIFFDYRYVESDALIDGFADSDFGAPLTGTNLKGYTVGGNLALSPRVSLGLRWMSADNIVGPTYKSDVIQVDINGKF